MVRPPVDLLFIMSVLWDFYELSVVPRDVSSVLYL